jgi:adenylylsulfate kinase
MTTHATRKRSVVKALSYRIIIVSLDFAVIYLLTGKTKVAVGFMIISNTYTTVGYFLHERLWARVKWGMQAEASGPDLPAPSPSVPAP